MRDAQSDGTASSRTDGVRGLRRERESPTTRLPSVPRATVGSIAAPVPGSR